MHLDDEAITLLALGETEPDAKQRVHLAGCEQCALELSELARTVAYGKSTRDVELLTPPERVWAAIQSELGLTSDVVEKPSPQSARVRPIRRWWVLTAAALVVGLVAGASVVLWWPQPSTNVVAEATLDPFPDWDASGAAQLEQGTSESSRDLLVTLDAAPASELREVWLMDPDTNGLISLGQLVGDEGRFTVPSGVDLGLYTVVDISQEPADGNPAHSGDSIVRGELHPA